MRKILFVILLMLAAICVYAQVAPEHQWIIGEWELKDNPQNTYIYYNDGTLDMFVYSDRTVQPVGLKYTFTIHDNRLTMTYIKTDYTEVCTIRKVNDQQMLLILENGQTLIFNRVTPATDSNSN